MFDELMKKIRLAPHSYDHLEELGFEFLGEGCNGEAYVNEDDVVLKIFNNDGAYLKWMEFCLRNQDNKYLPKLLSKVYWLGGETYAVFMELLELKMSEVPRTTMWDCIYYHRKTKDKMLQAVVDEIQANSDIDDLHDENILFRGDTPVVTDPWCGLESYKIDETLVIRLEA